MATEEPVAAGHRSLSLELTPLRITLLYLALGLLALFVSDVVIVAVVSDPLLGRIQAVKGGVEIVLTAGLIYWLTRRSRAQLRATNETLVRQREELDVLHRVLRHNLRNALTTIVGRSQVIEAEAPAEAEHCDRIQRAAEDVVGLVEKASRIRRVTAVGRAVELELTDTVRSVLENHSALGPEDDVRTALPEAVQVSVNPLFEEALSELVANAIEHGDGPRRIAVGVEREGGEVVITVADDGPGVGPNVRSVFERGDLDQLRHLDGMGLWFVYWTVTDSGGGFTIEDNDWGGTTVRITLPARAGATARGRRGLVSGLVTA